MLLLILIPAFASGETIKLRLYGDSFSVKIVDAPIKQVVKEIQEKKTIWIKGLENLPETNLSMEFKDMAFRQGLERILSSSNYCLIYGTGGNLDGVIILSNPKPKTVPSRKSKYSRKDRIRKQSSGRSSRRKR